jgi:RNA recognition motif-containing protein
MNLFIGNLPSKATEQDLCALLNLSEHEAQRRLRIFKKADRAGHTLRFGIVHVETDADLRKMLDRNRRAEMQGQRLDVREYVPRAAGNERRSVGWRMRSWPHLERRVSERRANT